MRTLFPLVSPTKTSSAVALEPQIQQWLWGRGLAVLPFAFARPAPIFSFLWLPTTELAFVLLGPTTELATFLPIVMLTLLATSTWLSTISTTMPTSFALIPAALLSTMLALTLLTAFGQSIDGLLQ